MKTCRNAAVFYISGLCAAAPDGRSGTHQEWVSRILLLPGLEIGNLDGRASVTGWQTVHHLIRALGSGGEPAAAALVAKLGTKAENARKLAYRLYTLCERKKRAAEALAYDGLVQSWPEIVRLAQEGAQAGVPEQGELAG